MQKKGGDISLKKFTYLDYIKAIHMLKTNQMPGIKEEKNKYYIEKLKSKEDELIKILEDKKEMASFLNNFLNFKNKIEEEDLTKVENKLIQEQSKNTKNTIIYKQKSNEVFFLVHHVTKIDEELTKKMLNFSIEVLNKWSRNKKTKKIAKKPIVIPIVIYTGREKIKKQDGLICRKVGNYTFENFEFTFNYNLINLKNISKQRLIEQNTVFSYRMIVEKFKKHSF